MCPKAHCRRFQQHGRLQGIERPKAAVLARAHYNLAALEEPAQENAGLQRLARVPIQASGHLLAEELRRPRDHGEYPGRGVRLLLAVIDIPFLQGGAVLGLYQSGLLAAAVCLGALCFAPLSWNQNALIVLTSVGISLVIAEFVLRATLGPQFDTIYQRDDRVLYRLVPGPNASKYCPRSTAVPSYGTRSIARDSEAPSSRVPASRRACSSTEIPSSMGNSRGR